MHSFDHANVVVFYANMNCFHASVFYGNINIFV